MSFRVVIFSGFLMLAVTFAGMWPIAGENSFVDPVEAHDLGLASTSSNLKQFNQMSGTPDPQALPDAKRILLINSYHYGFVFEDEVMRGLKNQFSISSLDVELTVEYLDTKNSEFTKAYEELLVEVFQKRYAHRSFDLVLAVDDNALDFVRRHHHSLFHDTPVVFTGINRPAIATEVDRKKFTGVLEVEAALETIEMALKLHPNTKRVEMVFDQTKTGNARWDALALKLRKLHGVSVRRVDNSMPLDELGKYLSRLNADTIVAFGSLYGDGRGRKLTLHEGAEFVTSHSPRPVYTFHRQVMPFGVVGGKVLGGYEQGKEAAIIALAVLSGKNPAEIPIVANSTAVYMFNFPQLKRFGVSMKALPDGAQILGQPAPFISIHPYFMGGSIVTILVLTGILLWISRSNRILNARETELRQALVDVDVARRTKDMFLANVSHELLTPLNAIIGFSELIGLNDNKPGNRKACKTKEYSEAILYSGKRLLGIVNSLIGITHVDNDDYQLQPRRIRFNTIVSEVSDMVGNDYISYSIAIDADCCNPYIHADPKALEQVLVNIISDVQHHNPSGTSICVKLRKTSNQAIIEIIDNGRGISKRQLEQIEKCRWDLDCANDAYVADGTCSGLGLRFSRKLVEKQGGNMTLDSKWPHGTMVTIVLPIPDELSSGWQLHEDGNEESGWGMVLDDVRDEIDDVRDEINDDIKDDIKIAVN